MAHIEINGVPYCDATPLTPAQTDQAISRFGVHPTCSGKDPQRDAEAIRAIRPDLDVRVIDAPCPSYGNDDIDY